MGGLEFAILLAAFLAVGGLAGAIRVRMKPDEHAGMLECKVAYRHRMETLAVIEGYFDAAHIRMIDIHSRVKQNDERTLYKSTYILRLPAGMTAADVAAHVSAFADVQSVHTKML